MNKNRPKERKARRSSILKKSPSRTPLEVVDTNIEETEFTNFDTEFQKRFSKRVSFADTNQIKEIHSVADIAKEWHSLDSSASVDSSISKLNDVSNLMTPLIRKQQQTTESRKKGPKDLQSLLKGTIVDQQEPLDVLNETTGSCAMDIANISVTEHEDPLKNKPTLKNISQLPNTFSFFDNSKLGFVDLASSSPDESHNIVKNTDIEQNVGSQSLYTKDFLRSIKLIDSNSTPDSSTPRYPQVGPPSYQQCLDGIGKKTLLHSVSDKKRNVTEKLSAVHEQISENVEDNQDEVQMDFTECITRPQLIMLTDDLENKRTLMASDDMDFTCMGPTLVNANMDQNENCHERTSVSADADTIATTNIDDSMDFTCVAPVPTLLEDNKIDLVYEVNNDKNKTPRLIDSDDNEMDFTCVSWSKTIPNVFGSEKDCTPEKKSNELYNIDNTDHFITRNDDMELTKALKVIPSTHYFTCDQSKQSSNCDVDVLVLDSQPVNSIKENTNKANQILNETTSPIDVDCDDKTTHFNTTISDDMEFTELFPSQSRHSENLFQGQQNSAEPEPGLSGGMFVLNTQPELTREVCADLVKTGIKDTIVSSDIVPSSGDSDLDADTWVTSAFTKKMSKTRNSIGVYKARQERAKMMDFSHQDDDVPETTKGLVPLVKDSFFTKQVIPETQDTVIPDIQDIVIPDTQDNIVISEIQNSMIPQTEDLVIPETQDKVIPESQDALSLSSLKQSEEKTSDNGDSLQASKRWLQPVAQDEMGSMENEIPTKFSKICTDELPTKETQLKLVVSDGSVINEKPTCSFLIPPNCEGGLKQMGFEIDLSKSLVEDANRLSQKKGEKITVEEFLRDYAHVFTKNYKDYSKNWHSIVPSSSHAPKPTGLKETFKAIYWTSKEVSLNQCFIDTMKKKIEWLEEDISKMEEELSNENPAIFKTIQQDGDESDQLQEKIQRLAGWCKSLGKAYWKRDKSKLYKGLQQASKQYINEDLKPIIEKFGSPQDIMDSTLKEIEEANANLDKLIEDCEKREKPPTKIQAQIYEEDNVTLRELDTKYENLLKQKTSAEQEKSEIQKRRKKLFDQMMNDDVELNKQKMEHKAMIESLNLWQKYAQWKMVIKCDKTLQFSFLSDTILLKVELVESLNKYEADKKIHSYVIETNTDPGNVVPAEREMYKMLHNLFKNSITLTHLEETYPDLSSLKSLLWKMSVLSSAARELMRDMDWISCQFSRCSCNITSENSCCDVYFLPPIVGVDGFHVKFYLESHDTDDTDPVNSVLKYGFLSRSCQYIGGNRQLDYTGENEILEVISKVINGRSYLRRSAEAVIQRIDFKN